MKQIYTWYWFFRYNYFFFEIRNSSPNETGSQFNDFSEESISVFRLNARSKNSEASEFYNSLKFKFNIIYFSEILGGKNSNFQLQWYDFVHQIKKILGQVEQLNL